MEEDILRTLAEREALFDEEAIRERLENLNCTVPPSSDVDPEDRSELLKWIHDVCVEELRYTGDRFFRIPTLAAYIIDRFLGVCEIQKSQLQLSGIVCLCLAGKITTSSFPTIRLISNEKLIHYADDSVTLEEIKAWEMLVLSKLHWNPERVLPQDYFDSWKHFSEMSAVVRDWDVPAKNAALMVTLSARDKRFFNKTPAKLLALSSLKLTLKDYCPDFQFPVETTVRIVNSRVEDLRDTETEMESLLWSLVKKEPEISGNSPNFKNVRDASTPKSAYGAAAADDEMSPLRRLRTRRSPLKDRNPTLSPRKRLQSDFNDCEDDNDINKENNDSAIGLNTSGLTELPDSCSSGTSSANSSPDSGAGKRVSVVLSERSNSSSTELDNVLSTTQITPLKKWE